jgi:hypothetical protein
MSSKTKQYLFVLFIITLIWSFAMGVEANRIATAGADQIPASCYFSGNPILDAELSPNANCFKAIVEKGAAADKVNQNTKLFRVNTWMDFLFILFYWTSFVLFAKNEESPWTKWIFGFITFTAIFDILENLRILSNLTSLGNPLPQTFSLVKWVFLAVALTFAAVLVWVNKGRLYPWLVAALVLSALLTIVGLILPRVMVYAGATFGLSFLLILARIFPYSSSAVLLWIEYVYLLRFQIAAAAILAVALPLAYYFVPSLFVGLFDARGFSSFLFIVWAAFELAWTILVTTRLVFVYGPARFVRATSIEPKPVGPGLVTVFGLLAVPVVAILFLGTDPSDVSLSAKLLATVLGPLLAIAVLALTASLHFAIEDPGNSAELIFPSFGFLAKGAQTKSSFWESVGRYLDRWLPDQLKPGVLDTSGELPRLLSGHEMATIALGVFLLLYASLGVLFSPKWWNPDREPAAMFFLLVLLNVLTWLFSGASFFLDPTRLPVFSTLLAVSLFSGLFGTDHKYVINEPRTGQFDVPPSVVVVKWKEARGKNQKTAVVVATAGGGIRAAAWTAEVTTRLQQDGCGAMSDSLLLVSSVSGGSVGSMFIVAPYEEKGKYPSSDDELRAVRFNAQRSSLSAVGWGLAYPDLFRTVPILGSIFVSETFDRGWSLEKTWSTALKRKDNEKTPVLSDWRKDVSEGHRPAVIFNGTASESGERFLISSTDGSFRGAEQFFELFPSRDLDVSTAARLSATFPYASPLAKASMLGGSRRGYHVGDGGYYDNSGLLSAVEWLTEAKKDLEGYEVVLILIDAQPGEPKPGSSWSWQKQMVGPIETLLHVRTSSQQVRSSIELDMVEKYLESHAVDTSPPPQPKAKSEPGLAMKVTTDKFLFWSPMDSDPPLSWHLTKTQKKEIGEAWGLPDNRDAWQNVRGKLGCTANLTILDNAQKGE